MNGRALSRGRIAALGVAGLLVFFAVWTLASLAGLASRQFLPPP